ncbi:MAG: RNA 2',3'-cyclic phosphodiesterase, partial [Pseudomonadota bacterium]
MNTKRLFFALWPDDRQRDRLRDVINSVAKTVEGKPIDRRDWHVTLSFIGVFPENRIPILFEKASKIEMQPFRLSFDRLEFWPRAKIAALRAQTIPAELQALVDSLDGAITELGVKAEERNYRPHITVVRNARQFHTERLTQRATFEWSSFELIESESVPGGTVYRPVKQ